MAAVPDRAVSGISASIVTHRLVLREWREGDAEQLFEAVNSSKQCLQAWLDWSRGTYRLEEAARFIAFAQAGNRDGSGLALGMFRGQEQRLVGSIGLSGIDPDRSTANLGYWVRTDESGNGYVKEACQALLLHAHRELGIAKVEVAVHPENDRSIRVATALGLPCLGIVKDRIRFMGAMADALVFEG